MAEIKCAHCLFSVTGDASVVGGQVVHAKCGKAYVNALAGRPFACPKCKTTGVMDSPTQLQWMEGWVDEIDPMSGWATGRQVRGSVQRPVPVPCDLCDGHGYTATEARPVTRTVVEGWRL